MEAMPYLQAFQDKIFVIKTGGNALSDPTLRNQLLQDLAFLSLAGIHPVLVHGGGPEITRALQARGITPKFVEGLRVTDKATLQVVTQTLKRFNQTLVRELREIGWRATGLSGASHHILKAVRHRPRGQDLGFVGKIRAVHTAPIQKLLRQGVIPVVIPMAIGSNNQPYNVNADQTAAALAGALRAEKLVLVTDVHGIYQDRRRSRKFVSTISQSQARALIAGGTIQSGMIPKTRACIQALRAGVHKTHMIDIKIPHGLLLEIFTYQGIGTEIVHNENAIH